MKMSIIVHYRFVYYYVLSNIQCKFIHSVYSSSPFDINFSQRCEQYAIACYLCPAIIIIIERRIDCRIFELNLKKRKGNCIEPVDK